MKRAFSNTAGKRSIRTVAAQVPRLVLLVWFAGGSSVSAGATSLGDITFFFGSDLHYGYSSGTVIATQLCAGVLDRMNALPGQSYPATVGGGVVAPPRGVLLLGDITAEGTPTQWAAFTNDWGLNGERRLPFPVYEGYGNHDTLGTALESFKARNPLRTGLSNLSSNGYHYSWDWDFLHLVCLNLFPGNEPAPNFSGLDPKRSLEFLAADLATRVGKSGRPVVLYHHYGFDLNSSWAWWSDQQRTDYFNVIKDYNVILLLAGHNHCVGVIKWQGVDTMNDGTIGMHGNFCVAHVTKTNLVVLERNSADTWTCWLKKPISVCNSGNFGITRVGPANPGPAIAVDVSGMAGGSYTLERATGSAGQSWSSVTTSEVLSSNRNLTLLDTAPPSNNAFYRVRLTLP
jgi:hypothetical protein